MRNRYFLLFDAIGAVVAVLIAFTARFEGLGWWPHLGRLIIAYALISIPLRLAAFMVVGLYRRLWRYASIGDLEIALAASGMGLLLSSVVGLVVIPVFRLADARVPVGVLLLDGLLTASGITLSRLLLRVAARRRRSAGRGYRWSIAAPVSETHRRVLIAGAGDAGGMIARELLENQQLGLIPIGFVDDDRLKHGHHLHGLKVFGSLSDIETIVQRVGIDEVITALPSARGRVIRDIMRRANAAGAGNRTVPGLYELLSGAKTVSTLRPIQIEDLLRREPIETDPQLVSTLARDKIVLVTGAGGSIGSELCRQIARLNPKKIVALGRGENSIFELLQELRNSHPDIPVRPIIADVRDEVRLRAVFEQERPFTVFHAAAHKHVPLMEASVDEAILNNVLGTRNVVELSAELGVEHMVLVSTDKAVRPTSIMGATKRIAEGTLCSVVQRARRPYVAVRFGNVLGSRGSVVPTFLKQIEAGGPITITHREMRRYFMTIPEAVQLVMQAGAQGRGGEVFVLDMGDPVRISDLAEDLVRLSGLELGSDIEIIYTGVRPGEKLYEELFFGPEDAAPTSHPKILRARDHNAAEGLDDAIDELIEAARRRIPETELRRMIKGLVPEYQPPQHMPQITRDMLADDTPDIPMVALEPQSKRTTRKAGNSASA
ncbi:MAG TPA: nucleoside-diphosphate sugar epimerase/dehydratase [Gemmatimonadaceae bacterium]|jgi:FlaA1/EpsC-like NDP-sugar epimerase|nr:nucleoside-diphosphate sugar epimerase/dehydratase [Gemmatimonadaceae bacterium]